MRTIPILLPLLLVGCAGGDVLLHPLASSGDIRPDLVAMGYAIEAAPTRDLEARPLMEARVASFVALAPVVELPRVPIERRCRRAGDVVHCEPSPSAAAPPQPFRTHVEVYVFASPAAAVAALPQARRQFGVGEVYRRDGLVVTASGGDWRVGRYLREAVGPLQ